VNDYRDGRYVPAIRLRRSNGTYRCISGHMRLSAMRESGIEALAFSDSRIVLVDDLPEDEGDLETIMENHGREELK